MVSLQFFLKIISVKFLHKNIYFHFFTFILGSLIIYAGNTFPYVMEIHFHKSKKYIHMYVKEMHSILWKKHPQFTVFFENYYLFLWLINNWKLYVYLILWAIGVADNGPRKWQGKEFIALLTETAKIPTFTLFIIFTFEF